MIELLSLAPTVCVPPSASCAAADRLMPGAWGAGRPDVATGLIACPACGLSVAGRLRDRRGVLPWAVAAGVLRVSWCRLCAGVLHNLQYVFGSAHPAFWLLPSLQEAHECAKEQKGA